MNGTVSVVVGVLILGSGQLAFGIPSFLILLKLFKSWKRYGGDEGYKPPVPDLAK